MLPKLKEQMMKTVMTRSRDAGDWSIRAAGSRAAALVVLGLLSLLIGACAGTPSRGGLAAKSDIGQYIARTWDTLTRSPLNCGALIDPKVLQGQSVLYVSADEPITTSMRSAAAACQVQIHALPAGQHVGTPMSALGQPGLLFVPNPYVVPGGRFNEMYGWDSYFIVEGLMESGRTELAQGMTENFFYELDHYGAVLNANRTYYLTRSQPPFLTSMVMAVARSVEVSERRAWMARGYDAAQKDWAYWNRPEMKAGATGLSRYFDFGRGPVPEMHDDPTYYQGVLEKLDSMGPAGRVFMREATGPGVVKPSIEQGGRRYTLTDDFYLGDRAMRASGFDVSFRFGPYGGATHHFAPVCLNSLLYREEMDLGAMAEELGRPAEASAWRGRADARKIAMMRYLWDDQHGMFFDYDFVAGKRSEYSYATTFCPLWAGLVETNLARRVADHLNDFLKPGGMAMSTQETGVQWDLPFGWAPLQMLAVEGLRRYGFIHEADTASERWLRMIVENFRREGTLREKYNVVTRSAEVRVEIGYSANVVGFGWTNAVFLKLLSELPPEVQARVLAKAQ
jgi:alpha,alpha-trehalase